MDDNPQPDSIAIETPPLHLPIDDQTLLVLLSEAERGANKEWKSENIEERSKQNVKFWKGDQVDKSKLDARFSEAHIDNVVHQNLENQIKLAAGKMPDIFVSPPDDEDYNLEAARSIQAWLRVRIDSSTIKRLIKNGLRSLNLNMTAVIKPRWDYQRRDFTFELVDPADIRFGEGAKIVEDGFTVDGVDTVFHYVEEPTQVVLAKFRKKQEELMTEIGVQTKAKNLPSRIRYTEIHFRWYDEQGRMSEGVCWRYGNLILDKMKCPYYDFDHPELNYFDAPRKPFILFSYLNLGKGIYESTTTFEQAIQLQRIINKRRRQITEISDRAIPKMAFTSRALTKEQAANISPSPQEGIFLQDVDDIRQAMMSIPGVPPNPILYQDLDSLLKRGDSMFATHGTTRGEGGSESGVSKQISREGDLVTSDDIVDIVIERVVTEMACWGMQFARLFYDEDRQPVRDTNKEGETKFIKLDRKTLETDIGVVVVANTNDKDARRADALQTLSGKVTDPYTFYEDLDVPNPKERVKRLVDFLQSSSAGDFTTYLARIGVSLTDQRASQDDAQKDIELLIQGGHPAVSKQPDEAYIATFIAFVQSPQFAQLEPGVQQAVQMHVEQLKRAVQEANPGVEQQPGSVEQALAGAPGTEPGGLAPQQGGFSPEVDISTAWNAGNGNPTMLALQSRVQPQSTPQQRMPKPQTSEAIDL